MSRKLEHNRTKIVATIGPATSSMSMLRKIIAAGVDVCRLNFSHGTPEGHLEVIKRIHGINEEMGLNVCILADLQGPKLRIGEVTDGQIHLRSGKKVLVTKRKVLGTPDRISVNYGRLTNDIKPGERILIDDGKIQLKVLSILNDSTLEARVQEGGPVLSRKGFNLPDSTLTVRSLTPKDREDLDFALEHGVDWIGMSFVRSSADVKAIQKIVAAHKSNPKIMAKIEKPQAIDNIDEIIEASDGIMVARGDLGVEMPMEIVPVIQKRIVQACLVKSKPVVIATQMMESMISSATPTRAEANDVANAVMDGADAVMLSAETSIGRYPLKAVQAVEKILGSTEKEWDIYYKGKKPSKDSPTFLSDEICFTAVRISDHIKAKSIISMTQSGYTAFKIASYRPHCKIFIFTANKQLFRILNLVWNVSVFYYNKMESTDSTMRDVLNILKEKKLLKKGELVVHTASMPIKAKGKTNSLKISRVD